MNSSKKLDFTLADRLNDLIDQQSYEKAIDEVIADIEKEIKENDDEFKNEIIDVSLFGSLGIITVIIMIAFAL